MLPLQGLAVFLLLGAVSAFGGYDRWSSESGEQRVPFRPDGFGFEALAIIAQNPFDLRPRPHPRRQPFFVGTFRSVPSRDWQINMYQVYNATGFPTSYVDEIMNITIVDLRNGTFRFIESAGNDTFYDLNFELNKPIVVNGTNTSSDGEYTFSARPFTLTVLSNNTNGLNRADVQFGAFGRSDGVDVIYHVLDPKIAGARHFRRVRRRPSEAPSPMMQVPDMMPDTVPMQPDSENTVNNLNSQPINEDEGKPEHLDME